MSQKYFSTRSYRDAIRYFWTIVMIITNSIRGVKIDHLMLVHIDRCPSELLLSKLDKKTMECKGKEKVFLGIKESINIH